MPKHCTERLLAKASHQIVTMVSKWTRGVNPQAKEYWISFREPVATPREVQIKSEEWNELFPGSKLKIAIFPDGSPHGLNLDASVADYQLTRALVTGVLVLTTAYLLYACYRWLRA